MVVFVPAEPAPGGIRHRADPMTATLADPDTPFAVLDRSKLERNVRTLRERLATLGVPLRLHVKTAKSVEVASVVFGGGNGPITVSTLAEAEKFADAGYDDIVYPFGIVASKLPRVLALLRRRLRLAGVLESAEQARAVADASMAARIRIPALVEIDCVEGVAIAASRRASRSCVAVGDVTSLIAGPRGRGRCLPASGRAWSHHGSARLRCR